MSSSPVDFAHFCGFDVNATSNTERYIYNSSSLTLLPCAELAFSTLLSIPLLFFTVINMCFVSAIFPRYDRWSTVYLTQTTRLGVSIATVLLFFIALILSSSSPLYDLTTPLLLQYFVLALIWIVYSALWMWSLQCLSWSRSLSLWLSYFFAVSSLLVIMMQRHIQFGIYDPRTFIIAAIVSLQFVELSGLIVENHAKRHDTSQRLDEEVDLRGGGDETANVFSKAFFLWTNSLIEKGSRRQLNSVEDVFELGSSLEVERIEREMVENTPTYFSDATHFTLLRSLLSTFGVSFFALAIPRFFSDAFTLASPLMLHFFVNSLEDDTFQETSVQWAASMVLCALLAAVFSAHFTFYVQKISLKVRAATVTSIYDKLTRVPLFRLGGHSSGRIMNFVSSDVDRIVNVCGSFHAFWSMPVQLLIALFLLYREIGLAFLAGLAAALILIPFNKIITNLIGKQSELMMNSKDQRAKLITETMQGMRTVKMSGWEDFFERRISQLREKELHHLKARKYLDAVCVYLWASAPLLITLSILVSYTLILHEKITAAKMFTTLALVNILMMPLNAFPWVLNGMVEAFVSLRRLDAFFVLHDLEYSRLYSLSQRDEELLVLEDVSFAWKSNEAEKESEMVPTVVGVSLRGHSGTVVGVAGPVGSGKTTLLLGILGEAGRTSGSLLLRQRSVDEGIAYVAQSVWLSRGSVRANILAGRPFDKTRYDKILHATCLLHDLKAFPGGDEYEISENGATLSGGQRVRVALARALYQDNTVYLLDDPFASLDRKVAEHIWKEAVEGLLKASGKLVIVASHDGGLLRRADSIVLLSSTGTVIKNASPDEVATDSMELQSEEEQVEEGELLLPEYVVPDEEEKQEGAVRVSVYASYAAATGAALVSAILAAILAMQAFKNCADWWLTRWTNGQSNTTTQTLQEHLFTERLPNPIYSSEEYDRSIYFLKVYTMMAGANTFFTLARAFLFAKGGIVAASRLHSRLLSKLLSAPVSWWDRTPAGRVINRMCADVYTVDDSLPFQMNILFASVFNLLGSMVVTLLGLPLLAPFFFILLSLYYVIQRRYRQTTVELKRLSSLSLSPLYSLLADTVNGLATIRAHRLVDNCCHDLRLRVRRVLRAYFSSLAASCWLSVRLSAIAVSVVFFVSVAAIVQHRLGFVDTGLVGLAVTYALTMTSLLNGLLGSFIETEKEMVSVERIDEYVKDVPTEADEGEGEMKEELRGRIELVGVSARYDRALPLAITGVSARIEAGQKVAVIGRTGSGKSTVFQALLRAVTLETGEIRVDGIDISTLPLRSLRRLFGIVPQSPFLFSGTLAENLQVDNLRPDRQALANVVRVAQLDKLLERIGGLDGEIEEGGRNLSTGEKQIVSICRVLLAKPKIVLVDEATAHLDGESRRRLFSLISNCLPLCTLLFIVHRPHSLADFDLVMRMDSGRLISCCPPTEDDLRLLDDSVQHS